MLKVVFCVKGYVSSNYFTVILFHQQYNWRIIIHKFAVVFFSRSVWPVGSFLSKHVHASVQHRKPLIQSPSFSPPSCSLSIFLGVCPTPLSCPTTLFKLPKTDKVQK